jgi:general secretion pathway protein G
MELSVRKEGFSLVELLVAVAIMVILAGVVGLKLVNVPGKARVARAKTEVALFKTALQMYVNDNRALPTARQGLSALVQKPTLPPIPENYPPGGYLDRPTLPLDPWGNDYLYLVPGSRGEAFEVLSYGADAQPGGEGEAADISSSDL